METITFSETTRVEQINRVVTFVQIFFRQEKDSLYSKSVVKKHVLYLIEKHGEQILEDDGELLIMSASKSAQELERLLEEPNLKAWKEPRTRIYQPGLFEETESLFNGHRKFSGETIDAMIIHLASKGKNLNPTRLNKLLFYSDFSYFRKAKRGISGIEYVALKYGPLFPNYDNTLRTLEKKGEIRVKNITSKGKPARIILPKKSYRPETSSLSAVQLRFLEWVIEKYDHLTTEELVLQSHREDAFWNSHFGESISYDHAHNLVFEPPDSLLDQ